MNQDTLEQLVDEFGPFNVLRMLENICYNKAEHLLNNWQDKVASTAWDTLGNKIGTFANSSVKGNLYLEELQRPYKMPKLSSSKKKTYELRRLGTEELHNPNIKTIFDYPIVNTFDALAELSYYCREQGWTFVKDETIYGGHYVDTATGVCYLVM